MPEARTRWRANLGKHRARTVRVRGFSTARHPVRYIASGVTLAALSLFSEHVRRSQEMWGECIDLYREQRPVYLENEIKVNACADDSCRMRSTPTFRYDRAVSAGRAYGEELTGRRFILGILSVGSVMDMDSSSTRYVFGASFDSIACKLRDRLLDARIPGYWLKVAPCFILLLADGLEENDAAVNVDLDRACLP
jgi:hypothetical protein